jgi:peptide chain release factor
MIIYISSGNGVAEVCRGLWHFLQWLDKRYDFQLIHTEVANCPKGYKSITLQSDDSRFKELEGTILWRAKSPFRPMHKRKNWYFSLSCYTQREETTIDESRIVYQTMKSPKKGGQHVNTTCSGVRARYEPLGIEAISYDERSQYRNRQIATARLHQKAYNLIIENASQQQKQQWKNGKDIKRGNPIKVFETDRFKEVK